MLFWGGGQPAFTGSGEEMLYERVWRSYGGIERVVMLSLYLCTAPGRFVLSRGGWFFFFCLPFLRRCNFSFSKDGLDTIGEKT